MNYTGIARAGEALAEVLRASMVPEVVKHGEQIGLCAPQDKGDFSVGIWLYDIRECGQMNTHEMVTIDSERQKYPSVYVNLYYMITAYSAGDLKYRAMEEALMLGKIIQTLSDTAVIDIAKETENAEPACQIILLELTTEEKMRICHVPDGAYKTSLFYEVGPVELASEKRRKVRRVVDMAYEVKETDGDRRG